MKSSFSLSAVFRRSPFIVSLPNAVDLVDYEICLESITLPRHIFNIEQAEKIEFRLNDTSSKTTKTLHPGYYESAESIVGAMNSLISSEIIKLHIDQNRRLVGVIIKEARASLQLSPTLATLLHLPTGTMKGVGITISTNPIDFPYPQSALLVTSDIVQKQFFNTSMLPYFAFIHMPNGGFYEKQQRIYHSVSGSNVTSFTIGVINALTLRHINLHNSVGFVTLHFRPATP